MKSILLTFALLFFVIFAYSQPSFYSEYNSYRKVNINDSINYVNDVNHYYLKSYSNLKMTGNYLYIASVGIASVPLIMNSNLSEEATKSFYIVAGITALTGTVFHYVAPYQLKKLSKYYNGKSITIPLNRRYK